jgi:hypothetical protein
MPEFQLLDERRYALKVKGQISVGYIHNESPLINGDKDMLPYFRWEHRVTVGYRAREFMVFVDQLQEKIYIEEIVGGHLETVEETSLFQSLLEFAETGGYCGIMLPIMKSSEERFV